MYTQFRTCKWKSNPSVSRLRPSTDVFLRGFKDGTSFDQKCFRHSWNSNGAQTFGQVVGQEWWLRGRLHPSTHSEFTHRKNTYHTSLHILTCHDTFSTCSICYVMFGEGFLKSESKPPQMFDVFFRLFVVTAIFVPGLLESLRKQGWLLWLVWCGKCLLSPGRGGRLKKPVGGFYLTKSERPSLKLT